MIYYIAMSKYEVLIKNATIVDGTGSPPFKGELAIDGERIAEIGKDLGSGEKIVDAGGKIVSPGFIDVHNHGDVSIIYYPKADGYMRQGITTFIGGQCGSSPAPCGEYVVGGMTIYDLFQELNPAMYYSSSLIKRDVINPRHKELFGWEIDWETKGHYSNKHETYG